MDISCFIYSSLKTLLKKECFFQWPLILRGCFYMKLSYKERINNMKPLVVVSRCLGFSACRYNGQMDGCHLVEKLKDFVEFITVCTEVQIGLETPREAIRVVK